MISKNSKTSDYHKLLLNLLDKINLKRSRKYVALSNLAPTWNEEMNPLIGHILYQIFKIILDTAYKNME